MKFVFSLTLALALLATAPALAYGGHGDRGDKIDVMTQNQYLGADLNPIIAAPDPIAFNQALIDALEQISANNYPARARKLAQLIAFRRPDLVGLQEMFVFACTPLAPPVPGQGCDDPDIKNAFNDHLELTLEELAALHAPYAAVAIVNNLDLTGPFIPNFPVDGLPVDLNLDGAPDITVTVLDRDVILARGNVHATPVDYTMFCPDRISVDGCNYAFIATAPPPIPGLEPIEIQRGWVGVDATVRGKDYRFVNTHLEVQEPDGTEASSIVQAAQAAELIGVLGLSTPPDRTLIVVGDINSSSEDPLIPGPWPFPPPFDQAIIPPYAQLVGSGYTDAWTELRYPRPGFTCCQADDLLNKRSELDERIDVIFSGPADVPASVRRGRVLGARPWDKTWSTWPKPLWPSDHGSVAAELEF